MCTLFEHRIILLNINGLQTSRQLTHRVIHINCGEFYLALTQCLYPNYLSKSIAYFMTIAVYGIPNCDTVRKARKWLDSRAIHYQFHDVREQPVAAEAIEAWLLQLGLDQVINKRSTAWRQLTNQQQQVADNDAAITLLQEFPTLMKRPLLAVDDKFWVGFNEAQWQQALGVQ